MPAGMNKGTAMLFALLAAFAVLPLLASAQVDGVFSGDIAVKLAKSEFNAGEALNAEISVSSAESFPIAEAVLVVEIVKGGDYYYPSSLSDNDSVVFEQRIDAINLRGGESKSIEFSYNIPQNAANGSYRLDAYLRTERTPIIGLAHIFMNPKSASFSVKDSGGTFPELKIARTKTEFSDPEGIVLAEGPEPDGIGPIGPPTMPGAAINGKVFIQNASGSEAKNVEVFAGLCAWDDSICDSFSSQDTVKAAGIPANSTKEVDVRLDAPMAPNAYAIRIEVRKDGKLESLYRNRAVVVGEGARIRELYSENVELLAGKQASFKAVISPSADHWLKPAFENFNLHLWVETMEEGKAAKAVFEKTEQVPRIDYAINFIEKGFSFAPGETLLKYRVCAEIEKGGKVFDSHCTAYDSSKFSKILDYSLKASWSRQNSNSLLSMKFCTLPEGQDISANYQLLSEDFQETIGFEDFAGKGCVQKEASLDSSKKYYLAVTDDITGLQEKYLIDIEPVSGAQDINRTGGNSVLYSDILSRGNLALAVELILIAIACLLLFVGARLFGRKKKKVKKK